MRAAADAHGGLLLSSRLAEFGVTPRRRRRLMADGWLTEVRRGVVLVGGGEPSSWHLAAAAWLLAGPTAALSHSTAARVHRLVCATPMTRSGSVELSIPRSVRVQPAGCVVHRVSLLEPADVVLHRGVRVTSAPRTLLDLAPALTEEVLAKTIDEGLIARTWSEAELHSAIQAAGRRPGAAKLRAVLGPRGGDSKVESDLEQRAARALVCFRPFRVGYQVVAGGRAYILDLAWPERLVGAECDGWTVRGRSRSKFDGDRRRNNALMADGWSIAHLTSAMSDDEIRSAVAALLFRSTPA
jgi:hypothetical protein